VPPRALHHPPRPCRPVALYVAQGGFARCFKFTNIDRDRITAGKVVDKASLHKAKAKHKVRASSWGRWAGAEARRRC
jgi:hypothetical protein